MARDLQLHVQLRHTGVWRRIVVPGDAAFVDLHEMLQAAMGWENAHLYAFRKGWRLIAVDEAYEPLDEETPPIADDVGVAEHLRQKGARCEYEYDFGDGWVLDLVVEALVDAPEDGRWILDGALAGPPEDCGGVPGYERLCAAFAAVLAPDEDDEDEELDELLDWAGDWRPDRFDAEAAMARVTHAGVGAREWAGAERELPFYVREDGHAVRMRVCVWADVDSGMILTAELNVPLKDALDRVIARFGNPPSRVLVEAEADRHRLRFAYPAVEVKPLASGALDEVFASLSERFGDVRLEPRYLEPGGSPRAVEGFFAAMTALHRVAPWERLAESRYLALRAPALDVDVVVSVIGAADISQGVVVYGSVDCAERFVRAAYADEVTRHDYGGRVLNLTYAPRADLSAAMRKERARYGWSHPRGSAPHVIALDPDGVIGPVFDADYRLAILAARATCAVMDRVDELEAGALSLRASVELPDEGEVEIEVTHPVPELAAKLADLDEDLELPEYDPELGPDPQRWLALGEADRIALVLLAHEGIDTGEAPRAHAAMHAVIETQLALGDPPGARQGYARLRAEGLTRHDTIHALAAVLSEHLFRALSKHEELDVGALDASLASVSAAAWRASMVEPPRRRPRSGPRRRRKNRKR